MLNRQLISQTAAVKFYMIQYSEAFITEQKGKRSRSRAKRGRGEMFKIKGNHVQQGIQHLTNWIYFIQFWPLYNTMVSMKHVLPLV